MKHTKKKRVLALVLCMALVLSTGIAAFANENVGLQSVACPAKTLERVIKNADGEQIGTLTADIPEGAFYASSSDANIQMEIQPDSGEAGVLNRVQQQMETEGITGYDISNYVMGDVTFYVNGEAQTPQQPVTFHMTGTSVNADNAMAFADDRQSNTKLIETTTDENGGLQFTAEAADAQTIVYGVFEKTEAENADESGEADVQTADDGVAVQAATGSGYELRTEEPNGVDITVQHYLENAADPLYKETIVHLDRDKKIENLSTLTNYTVVKVVEVNGSTVGNTPISGTITLNSNKTYRIYYRKNTKTVAGDVQMFDYYVNQGNANATNGSINAAANYPSDSPANARLASGNTGGKQQGSTYDTYRIVDGKTYYLNAWVEDSNNNTVNKANGLPYGQTTAATGIITGINYKTGALAMGMGGANNTQQLFEPGFFTNTNEPEKAGARNGKVILSGYQIVFNQNGDTYTMTKATHNGQDVTNGTAGANFFPLDDITNRTDTSNYEDNLDNATSHNDFFGMRYDVSFTLGGYLGDLNYSFTGDDDLWVVLDAAKDGSNNGRVVLDLGGIHAALTGNVDLWKELLGQDTYTLEDKINYLNKGDNATKEHTLTVLYMERGANVSNCDMSFTLPNSKIIETSDIVKSDLELTKVNTSGAAIEGAEFELVNNNNTSDTTTITSDANGKLNFTGLREGNTYTLTEKSVPSPYVAATTSWQVKMEGSPLKAVLYDSTGTTAQTLDTDGTYHIVNNSQDEIVSGSVESSKTVTVKDYDERTYTVDLTASSKATQTVTTTTPYDIVMVLDTSGSMSNSSNGTFYNYTEYNGTLTPDYKRFQPTASKNKYFIKTDEKIYQSIAYNTSKSYWYYKDEDGNEVKVTSNTVIYTREADSNNKMTTLKNVAKEFVANVNSKNPDSRISIVSYAGDATISEDSASKNYLLRVGDSKSTIDSWINSLSADGATRADLGLAKAETVFATPDKWANVQQSNGRKKMVVFLTDGVPTKKSDYQTDVAKDAVKNADSIKTTYNAEIYSLGIFNAADESGNLGGTTYTTVSQFMKDVASDNNKYMTADSVSSLYSLFDNITSNLDVSITATITDVIDSRFELTSGEKEKLEATGATVTSNSDGTTIVTWTNTTVNSKNGNTPGWHQTIDIKAKDNFIGGNMIPTNGSSSGITVDGNTKLFPQPSVNVKLLTPSIGDKEITYYKGDTIESSKFSGELLGTYKITELDGTTTLTVGNGIPALTEKQLNSLKAGGTVEVPYSYTNSDTDIEGVFKYEYVNTKYEHEGTAGDPLNNHPATQVGQDVEEYTLKVTFVPKTVDERKTLLNGTAVVEPNTDASVSGTVVSDKDVTGTYKVHVLALWAIVKQSTSADANGNHPKLSGAEFELVKDGNVCYKGVSDKDGFVQWYKDNETVSLQEIEKATYILRETKSPAGYAKSNIKWTIEITNSAITVKDANGNNITATTFQSYGETYDTYVYENTPVYELPSTGGPGIFLFTIGGMLLMGGAAWILYKNKRREVLKR